jgi:hypothetical protein
VVAGLAACGGGVDPEGTPDARRFEAIDADTRVLDARPVGPDAREVDCPPGLPSSFGNLGTADANKNSINGNYNVFIDLDDDPRWFFAMNLHPGRGVFSGGVEEGKTYEIIGEDTDEQYCSLCINLFADQDGVDGGPSQHMFAQKGRLVVTDVVGDATATDNAEVSGRLEDVLFSAIEIVYDDDSQSCGDDIDDPVCVNSICLNQHCGRQQNLVGCTTAIEDMTF